MKICVHKIKRVALPSGTMAAGYTFGRPRLSPAKSGGVIFLVLNKVTIKLPDYYHNLQYASRLYLIHGGKPQRQRLWRVGQWSPDIPLAALAFPLRSQE